MLARFIAESARKSWIRASVLLLLISGISACHQNHVDTELLVSSAVSLKDVLIEVATAFEHEHPGTKVIFNFGASGQLAQQILQGAPADLFVSASDDQIDELLSKRLVVTGSIHDCAGNRLVVLSSNGKSYESFEELAKVQRLAIGDPRVVPVGAYAKAALQKARLYDLLSAGKRLVFAEDARQVLTYVEGGDVDAGLVYNTDALLAKKSKISFVIPENFTRPMHYKAAVVETSHRRDLAGQFGSFLSGPRSRQAFEKRGFLP